jgi:hypothetical protein
MLRRVAILVGFVTMMIQPASVYADMGTTSLEELVDAIEKTSALTRNKKSKPAEVEKAVKSILPRIMQAAKNASEDELDLIIGEIKDLPTRLARRGMPQESIITAQTGLNLVDERRSKTAFRAYVRMARSAAKAYISIKEYDLLEALAQRILTKMSGDVSDPTSNWKKDIPSGVLASAYVTTVNAALDSLREGEIERAIRIADRTLATSKRDATLHQLNRVALLRQTAEIYLLAKRDDLAIYQLGGRLLTSRNGM